MQAALLSLINIDSTKGNSILLYTVKNTTWINFTISQFSVLIKKQRSPLKKSISTKEAKERIPLPVYRPAALSIQRHAWRCFWAFLLYTYSTSVEQKIWYSLSRICRDYFFFCLYLRTDSVERQETWWESGVWHATNRLLGRPRTILLLSLLRVERKALIEHY